MASSSSLSQPVIKTLQRVTQRHAWQRLYDRARRRGDAGFCAALCEEMGASIQVSAPDLGRIPKSGPAIVVANHPFGLLEGVLLGSLLPCCRPDVKFVVNSLLSRIPELRDLTICVDPYGGAQAVRANLAAMKSAQEWLREGHLLVMFPAGEVATLDLKRGGVAEKPWNSGVVKLAGRTSAPVIPLHLEGSNSPLFHLAGLVHPRLRTLLLPHELLNKQSQRFQIRIGHPIPAERLESFESPQQAADYLRKRVLVLGNRPESRHRKVQRQPVAPAVGEAVLARELASLPDDRRLLTSGEYEVWLADAAEIPNLLPEIGRLREIAFRAAGEGSGKPTDLDPFDAHYKHLFLWHPESRGVAGAYRLGLTDEILVKKGIAGLYTDTLFCYDLAFFRTVGPAVELGRSFVAPGHQKSYSALLSLWKGIGRFLVRNPHYRHLFGPVSISNDYLPASRHLLVEFLSRHRRAHLAHLVSPRHPFRKDWAHGFEVDGLVSGDPEDLSAILADIEPDEKGLPVLLRQYLKLGGELLAFNLDRKFSDVLDGLILVDLPRTELRMLERYMGREGAALYRAWHNGNMAA